MTDAFRRPVRVTRFVGLALATVLGAGLLPASTAQAAAPPRITDSFFGMSDGQPAGTTGSGFPKAPVGTIRVWDAGAAWNQIELSRGKYSFARLDSIIKTARTKGARPLLVLGQTPRFHASHPGLVGSYGAGAPTMPNRTSWKAYIAAVATRYRGNIDYQVWNEPNVAGYWRGSQHQMATLTFDAARVLSKFAPRARLLAPSFPVRLAAQRAWFSKYYAQRVAGRPVAAYVDAVAVNPYPTVEGTPETSMTLLRAAKKILAQRKVHKPVWNTEINYGLTGRGTNARNISARRQAAYVSRTYLLNASANVKRVVWYAWDLHRIASVEMTTRNNTSLTRAGVAYKVVASWLIGGRVRSCKVSGSGTFRCTVGSSSGVRRIYWNPTRTTSVRAVGSATLLQGTLGATKRLRGNENLKVNFAPIMVRSRR